MKQGKRLLISGVLLLLLFVIWTALVCTVDVQCAGESGTAVGLATINVWFHEGTGVHMQLYTATDGLSLIPALVLLVFGGLGVVQLVKRRSLRKVDSDLLLLGAYYVVVLMGYLVFEWIPINYRPILIEGRMEVSYPSSTTLLVLAVMPTVVLQANRRLRNPAVKTVICVLTVVFSVCMVAARLVSGVHWLTDIVGGALLSAGLFQLYHGADVLWCRKD